MSATEDAANLKERMARMEQNHSHLDRWFREALTESLQERRELRQMIGALTSRLDKQMTFVGGVVFAISAIWAFATYAWGWLAAHLR